MSEMELYRTRAEWLAAATVKLQNTVLHSAKIVVPYDVHVGCVRMRTKSGHRAIGRCHLSGPNDVGLFEIVITVSPALSDRVRVLAVLVHELVHAVADAKCGHKGPFRQLALRVGLTGKMTTSVPGPALRDQLTRIANDLGSYPRATPAKRKCTGCGYVAQAASKWPSEVLTCPICKRGAMAGVIETHPAH